MRELQDLLDIFPYCLLVALPIMIILSPTAQAVGHEFPAHRLAQFDLGGISRGPKAAALSMDARSVPTDANVNLLRKTVISRIQDMSVGTFNEMVTGGAGGILLLLPNQDAIQKLSDGVRESIKSLQEHLYTTEFEIPIYFAEETPELLELLSMLGGETGEAKKPTALDVLMSSISNYGYQLVSANSAVPKALADPQMTSIEAILRGKEQDSEAQPTIVVSSHYDTDSLAPSLPTGVNSNGSGLAVLLELARIFGKMYASSKSRPPMRIAFLLSSGGALNYFGTKKWLESHLDQDSQIELLNDVPFVACLDTLSGYDKLRMHVSKPPKADSHAGKFLANLGENVEVVHKKINLADELLAWEHERFSIRRLPALTLSGLKTHDNGERSDVLDNYADPEALYQHVKKIGEALACTLYNNAPESCTGNVLTGSLAPSRELIASWIDIVSETPRFASMTAGKNDLFVQTLLSAMKSSVGSDNVRAVNAKRDSREPEFVLYDGTHTTITAYKVKPAVFDLVLTLSIGAYLGLVYLAIYNSSALVTFVTKSLTAVTSGATSSSGNGVYRNGTVANGKIGNGSPLNNNGSPNGLHMKRSPMKVQ